MNPRHCLSAHQPNPPFQPTRVDVWLIFPAPSVRAAERGVRLFTEGNDEHGNHRKYIRPATVGSPGSVG